MNRLRQLSTQSLKWTSIGLFVVAFLAVLISQRTTIPVDVIFIIIAIACGIAGFITWLMYGERVDGGPRR